MIDLNKYKDFVKEVTSPESNNTRKLTDKLEELDHKVNIALLMTGSIGLASEGGEFSEIVKKCVFQGKPLDSDTIFHMKRELGDIMWYWSTACMALNLDPFEVIEENRAKLEARYGEQFEVKRSEHRKDGDL